MPDQARTVTLTGHSDDCIELDGAIREEFYLHNGHPDDGGDYIAFSDGTIVKVTFGREGVWRITPAARGAAALTITQTTDDEGTDTAVLDPGDGPAIVWAAHSIGYAKART